MPQDFKVYLNTSFYKITGKQFLISPIPHNKKQTFAIDDFASDNIIGSPADRFLAKLQGTKYPIYPVRTKEEEELYDLLTNSPPSEASGITARIKAKSSIGP
ncbi:hypothetical protein V1504DRAFT_435727 [Lipomyces starkeyi]